mgnify:CR=1 FL=1
MTVNLTAKISDLDPNNENLFRAQFSTSSDFTTDVTNSDSSTPDQFGLMKFRVSDLLENVKYFVRIVDVDLNPLDAYVGSFRTPSNGAHSFKFGFASCSWSGPRLQPPIFASNQQIYDKIADRAVNGEIEFFIHLGDMHYSDLISNKEADFQQTYDTVFSASRQNNCWKNLPMYYMWDDHDYGPNDTSKENPSRQAAIAAYRRRVPHPPSAKEGIEDSPYYSFVRGRVRFIVTDIRSEREPKGKYPSTDSRQQVFSADQKAWFFNEMLSAKNNNEVIVWANTKPWVSSTANLKDDWGGYHAARMEIVDFINTNQLNNRILVISGDMHALAYDDGTSPNNYGSLKVCHAAALDQEGRAKGGPYKIGPVIKDSGTGWVTQYGIIEVTDTGAQNVNIRFRGIAVSKTDPSLETTEIDTSFNLVAVQ